MSEEIEKDVSNKPSECWPEIKRVFETKRFELVLVGAEISTRIEKNGGLLDSNLFKLKHLNFLEIAKTKLAVLPKEICHMENLSSLLCHSNELIQVPAEIGKLEYLKNLDLSNNKLSKLPEELKNLKELFTLNLAGNQLDSLFQLDELKKLSTLDISRNKFKTLSGDLGWSNLENLHEIDASYNELVELSENLAELPALKTLNLVNNQITTLPAALCRCNKLKDLLVKENKLKDNRFKKLVEQDKTKAIFEYLEKAYAEECKNKPKANATTAGKNQNKKNSNQPTLEVEYDLIKVYHFNDKTFNSLELVLEDSVVDTRPFIICAILRGIDLASAGNYKKFLNIQNKLHDETCEKRNLAAIATHDLSLIKSKLTYQASEPNRIQLVPLGRKNPIYADDYYEKLMEEAEAERKAKKRNQLSGIYKYLTLLENQKKFAYISDSESVISLPPLTNAEKTRISTNTKDVLLEVTSSVSIEICKKVIEELLLEMINAGIVTTQDLSDKVEALSINSDANESQIKEKSSEASNCEGVGKLRNHLCIQQVKIVDSKANLKNVYPSRVDLNFGDSNKLRVLRTYDEQ